MGEVVRQGFLTKKTYMYVGRKVTLKKWKPKWVVLTRRGIFFFDYRCVEVRHVIIHSLIVKRQIKQLDIYYSHHKILK
jgi:hypothetical protein